MLEKQFQEELAARNYEKWKEDNMRQLQLLLDSGKSLTDEVGQSCLTSLAINHLAEELFVKALILKRLFWISVILNILLLTFLVF